MDVWLKAALDYLPRWLEYQMRASEQPGCAVAVAHKGRVVLELAYGHADALAGQKLTPRHRFRVASHSKSFTATGIMKLREQGKLGLDDPAGRYVDGLHEEIARATLAQLLSHSAGVIRDGRDAGQWQGRRPFLNERELRSALAEPPIIDAATRFKYSNHGFGLLGLVLEAVTGEPYRDWIRREVVLPSGLKETEPDVPLPKGAKLARGHSSKLPLGHRVIIPGDETTAAMAPATGFVSTAADLARFFASLDPSAPRSVLLPASRREMIRRHWAVPHMSAGQHYGLGLTLGQVADWQWFGHGGGFPSCISRTVAVPGKDLSISILTNAVDGWANLWSDGALHVLRTFEARGGPSARTREWSGRWWSSWGCIDLVPASDHVLVAVPGLGNPFVDAGEIEVSGKDAGRIRLAGGFGSHGEDVRLIRGRNGKVGAVQFGGGRLLPEARLVSELKRRYGS